MSAIDSQKIRELANIFAAKTIRDVANSNFSAISTYIEIINSFSKSNKSLNTLEDLYELSFELLSKAYRQEYIYKSHILNKKLLGRHSLKSASMLTELKVENSKADCVILNGISTCYEIKTELDTFNRLPNQIKNYLKYFDKVYVVTNESHFKKHLKSIPESVGIITLNARNQFSERRPAKRNECHYDPDMVARILRVKEIINVVEALGFDLSLIPNTQHVSYCKKALSNLSSEDLREICLTSLKARGQKENKIVNKLPSSLRLAGTSVKLTVAQKKNLLLNLKKIIVSKDHDVLPHTAEQTI